MEFFRLVGDAVLAPAMAQPTAANVLFALAVFIGAFVVVRFFVNLVLGVVSIFTANSGNLRRKYGAWAVVTGATDGIGLAYAKQFAKRGLNVVLISRTESKLQACAEDIKAKYPSVETRYVVADYSQADTAMYDRIRVALSGLDIGILVNNVGMSYPGALYFHEVDSVDPNLIDNLIALNVESTTQMTRLVVGDMVKRRRGAIINVSSAAGRMPVGNPLYAVYSGAKAYIDFFSRSLYHELASSGVHVQCQSPYLVATKLSKIRRTSVGTPSPDAYAAAAVRAIGSGPSTVPYWSHGVQDWLFQHLPTAVTSRILLSMHKGLRRRFFKKRETKSE